MGHWLILLLGSDPMELPLTVALTDIGGEGFKLEGFCLAVVRFTSFRGRQFDDNAFVAA